MQKLVMAVISLIILTESLDRKHMTRVYVYINDMLTFCIIVRVISVENEFISEERFLLEVPTSLAMLATARPLVFGSSHFYTKRACVEYDVQLDVMQ